MSTDAPVTTLEQAMAELALAQARTQANIDRTQANIDRRSDETRDFKAQMQAGRAEDSRRDQAFFAEMRAMRVQADKAADDFRGEMGHLRAQADKAAAAHRKEMGELSRKMGTLTEDIVAPGIPDVFRELFHVEVEECLVRQRPRHKQEPARRREFDVVAWGGDVFLLNETRGTLMPSDVDEVLAALAEVRGFFPEAEGRRVLGALASFRADPSLVQAAERSGLLVFGLSSGLLDVLNRPGFRPREF